MPTYEYKCAKCGLLFELVQRMSDAPISTCGTCGGKVKRLIGTGAGIIFKGSGYYCTDFKTKTGTPDTPPPKPSAVSPSPAKTSATSSTPATPASPAKPAGSPVGPSE